MARYWFCQRCNRRNQGEVTTCVGCKSPIDGAELISENAAEGDVPLELSVAPTVQLQEDPAVASHYQRPLPNAATISSVQYFVCPHSDCGGSNPPTATRCDYCYRPLVEEVPPAPSGLKTGAVTVGATSALCPLVLCNAECWNVHELAPALVLNWEAGVAALNNGDLLRWVRDELRDVDLTNYLADLLSSTTLSTDMQLLHILRHIGPQLSPVWKGYSVSVDGLRALANQGTRSASAESAVAITLVEELYSQRVLFEWMRPELADIEERWRQAVHDYEAAWAAVIGAGGPSYLRPALPELLPRLLAIHIDSEFIEQIRRSVRQAATTEARACPWFRILGSLENATGPALLVLRLLVDEAARTGTGVQELSAEWVSEGGDLRAHIIAQCRDVHYQIGEEFVVVGRRIVLIWDAPDAQSVTLRPGVGTVATNGEYELPFATCASTEFQLDCRWLGNVQHRCTLRVEVAEHHPDITLLVGLNSSLSASTERSPHRIQSHSFSGIQAIRRDLIREIDRVHVCALAPKLPVHIINEFNEQLEYALAVELDRSLPIERDHSLLLPNPCHDRGRWLNRCKRVYQSMKG